MDAVEYVKTKYRLCRSKDSCFECPLQDKENCGCITDTIEYVGKAVQIVEEWAKDNPAKTRKSEFLKMFPNAQMVDIERIFCVAHFDVSKKCKGINPSEEQCIACRYRFWNEEMADND